MQDTIERLERDVRRLKLLVAAMLLVMGTLGVVAFADESDARRVKVLDVERINIVEADGTPRLVIANAARFPAPMLKGKESGTRKIKPAGMMFLSADGSEMGGLALTDTSQGKVAAMLFDYDRGRQISEAIGVVRRMDPQGNGSAMLMINDPPPVDADPKTVNNTNRSRIVLQNPDRNAEVLLADSDGKPRIRLLVDKAGDARIEVLDAAGKVLFRAPEAEAG